jgi:RNA polymerase sigma-70 factor (ECF subfamily)
MVILQDSQSAQWQAWAAAAQQGDKKAYSALLGEIAPYIRNILSGSLSSTDAAEDVMQEVLISVHKSLKSYNPELAFKPWLSAIINFRRTDYLRKYYARRDDKTATTADNPEFLAQNVTNPAHAGELKDIELALSTLPKKQQHIFRRIKLEGYSAKEVANEMNMNETAVKVSAHRTMKKLQSYLK